MVPGDGIEPPTLFHALRANGTRGLDFEGMRGVVARDGIEPPTPAFSGPRSTTELSGLSAIAE